MKRSSRKPGSVPAEMKIAHVISALGNGGMEVAVARLVMEQRRLGYDVHLVCIRELGPMETPLRAADVPVHLCPFRSRLHPASLWNLRAILRDLRINVVQTHNYRPNVSGTVAAFLARIPAIVSTLHTVNRWDTRRQYWMDRALCPLRDAIVCVSEQVRDQYALKMPGCSDKLTVIHNGIDPVFLEPLPRAENLLAEAGLRKDDMAILCMARLVEVKDHNTLLQAHRMVLKHYPRAFLLLLGDGPLKSRLVETAEALGITGRVMFLGHRNNPREWLSIANCSVLSTHVEGFSSTVLESMAAGVPMIATAVGGNPEAIRDGETGYLTPPSDPQALAQRILEVLSDPTCAAAMAARARYEVAQRFTVTVSAGNMLELYRRILEQKPVES